MGSQTRLRRSFCAQHIVLRFENLKVIRNYIPVGLCSTNSCNFAIRRAIFTLNLFFRLIPPTEVSSGRIQVLVTENKTQLSVNEIKSEDVGTWQCLASSTAGSATCRTKLDLEG